MRKGQKRPIRNIKATLRGMQIAPPSMVLPLDWNPNSLRCWAKLVGVRFVQRKMPDGWWIWRIE